MLIKKYCQQIPVLMIGLLSFAGSLVLGDPQQDFPDSGGAVVNVFISGLDLEALLYNQAFCDQLRETLEFFSARFKRLHEEAGMEGSREVSVALKRSFLERFTRGLRARIPASQHGRFDAYWQACYQPLSAEIIDSSFHHGPTIRVCEMPLPREIPLRRQRSALVAEEVEQGYRQFDEILGWGALLYPDNTFMSEMFNCQIMDSQMMYCLLDIFGGCVGVVAIAAVVVGSGLTCYLLFGS